MAEAASVPGGRDAGGGPWLPLLQWFFCGAGTALAFAALIGLSGAVAGGTAAGRGAALAALFAAFALGGRLARRGGSSAPLLLAALFLAASPWLVPFLAPLGGVAFRAASRTPAALFFLRFVVLVPAVILPAGLLGAALRRAREEQAGFLADSRSEALRIAVFTAGAAAATANAGFRLLPWGGDRGVALIGAGALFVAAVLTGWRLRAAGSVPSPAAADTGEIPAAGGLRSSGALFAGFCAVLGLAAWERVLTLVFGPYAETTALTVGIFLAGCALGSLAPVLWPNPLRVSPLSLPAAGLAAGGLTAITLCFADRLPPMFLAASQLAAGEPLRFAIREWGIAALLVLPPALGFGFMLPMLRPASAGGGGSRLLAAGAALGAFLVPVEVIPRLGFRSALYAGSGLLLAHAAAGLALARGMPRPRRVLGIVAALALSILPAWVVPRQDPRQLSTGVHRYAREIRARFGDPAAFRIARGRADVPFYREGKDATVAVESLPAEVSPILAITRDGAVVGTTYYDLVPQILSSEIPLLLRPQARWVLLAGYGTGIGAGSALLHPITRLDVAEPEPAVVEASRRFEPGNRAARKDPRVTITPDDPRQVILAAAPGAYDLMILRPSAPESAGARYLFTRELAGLAASRLGRGGMLALAVPVEGLSAEALARLGATLHSALPEMMILQTYYQELLILAAREPIQFDFAALAREMESERVAVDLARIGLVDPDTLVIRHRLSGRGLAAFIARAPVYSDSGAPLAWSGFRPGAPSPVEANLDALDATSTGIADRIAGLPAGEAGNAILIRLARAAVTARDPVRAADLAEALIGRGDPADGHEILGDAHHLRREAVKAVEEWHRALAVDPNHRQTLLSLALFNADRQNWTQAEAYLKTGLAAHPGDPEFHYQRGRALYYLKRYPEAEKDLVEALKTKGEDQLPMSLYYLGLIQKEKRNWTGSAELLRRYLEWAYRQARLTAVEADVHLTLAEVYRGMNLPDLADQQRDIGEALKQRLKEMSDVKEKAALEYLARP